MCEGFTVALRRGLVGEGLCVLVNDLITCRKSGGGVEGGVTETSFCYFLLPSCGTGQCFAF